MTAERTLVLVKPDGVRRRLVGEVLGRLERRGLRLVGLKCLTLSRERAMRHYAEHAQKPFFEELVDFITSAPLVASVWEGPHAVAMVRTMMGATNPVDAAPGTIRADLAVELGQNIVHGSDSPARAAEEVALFFEPGEVLS
ncbi:MAG: nucleoside-diphosphate kinase [Candidatus Dormibacteria bacterium]